MDPTSVAWSARTAGRPASPPRRPLASSPQSSGPALLRRIASATEFALLLRERRPDARAAEGVPAGEELSAKAGDATCMLREARESCGPPKATGGRDPDRSSVWFETSAVRDS